MSSAAGLALAGAALCGGAARADGLLHIANCRIADDRGPIKAMGVNYVGGFWNFAKDGKREAYLPYLDALAAAKIPFIRMGFAPWAAYSPDKPPAPLIADFVEHRERWFARLATFLADLKARHIGVVLDVFWNIDAYTVYFKEPLSATSAPRSRTFAFLTETVAELARRLGNDPNVWMIEFANEGDLSIDHPRAPHSRAEFVAQTRGLAKALRGAGDRHLIDSGNALPRPAAEHLDEREGWTPDSKAEFLRALDAETPVDVVSIHVYPEKPADRPWDGGDVLNALPVMVEHSRKTCKPVFIGEFGTTDGASAQNYIRRVGESEVQMTAVWGFARPDFDPFKFTLDAHGIELLKFIGHQERR